VWIEAKEREKVDGVVGRKRRLVLVLKAERVKGIALGPGVEGGRKINFKTIKQKDLEVEKEKIFLLGKVNLEMILGEGRKVLARKDKGEENHQEAGRENVLKIDLEVENEKDPRVERIIDLQVLKVLKFIICFVKKDLGFRILA